MMCNSTLILNLIVLLLLVVVVRNGPSKLHLEEDELINLPPGTTPYNILAAVFCLRGIIRALHNRGHKVTVILTDACGNRIDEYMPGITDYHHKPIVPSIDVPGNPVAALKVMDGVFRLNGTVRLFEVLDDFIRASSEKYDLLFGDQLATGVVVAGKKHGIPVVSQKPGVLLPTAGQKRPIIDRLEIPIASFKEGTPVLPVIANSVLLTVYELAISYWIYSSLQEIHSKHGLETVPYDYGKFPFGYNQRNSILLCHAAPPLSNKHGHHYENVQYIGFVPDDVMYPPLSEELGDWLEKAGGTVVFISLGTVTTMSKEQSVSMFNYLRSHDNYFFIWAVKKPTLKHIGLRQSSYVSERLFMGHYLPQGSILQHPKVKLFVTHCGANSMQDSVHALVPMITRPGFGDQPMISNLLVSLDVARLLNNFDHHELESPFQEMLSEPNYSRMVEKLQRIRDEQMKAGGFDKGVEIIEKVIEGKIKINRSVSAEDVFGNPLHEIAIVCIVVVLMVFVLPFLLILTCCCWKTKTAQTKRLKTSKVD